MQPVDRFWLRDELECRQRRHDGEQEEIDAHLDSRIGGTDAIEKSGERAADGQRNGHAGEESELDGKEGLTQHHQTHLDSNLSQQIEGAFRQCIEQGCANRDVWVLALRVASQRSAPTRRPASGYADHPSGTVE